MEEWKPAPGYERDYLVSSEGRIASKRTRKPKLLKPIAERHNGYNMVTLYDEHGVGGKVRIGRLVALAFIPNPDNLPCVNHKDEIKTHDVVENLEWCTKAYNNTYGTARQRAVETRRRTMAERANKVLC